MAQNYYTYITCIVHVHYRSYYLHVLLHFLLHVYYMSISFLCICFSRGDGAELRGERRGRGRGAERGDAPAALLSFYIALSLSLSLSMCPSLSLPLSPPRLSLPLSLPLSPSPTPSPGAHWRRRQLHGRPDEDEVGQALPGLDIAIIRNDYLLLISSIRLS